jgi:hypothetical protein
MAKDTSRQLHIDGIPAKVKRDLKNIAANMGVTMNAFVKQQLTVIVNSQPEHLKKEPEAA